MSIDTAALARLPQDGTVSHFLSVTEDCSPSTLLLYFMLNYSNI